MIQKRVMVFFLVGLLSVATTWAQANRVYVANTGFIAIRQKGSHIRLEKRIGEKVTKLTVPVHNELKKGTLHRILKDAGISLEDFDKL